MTEREWTEVVDTMALMWPDRQPWPTRARRRCYRLLQSVDVEVVYAALERLKGPHLPSPAALESEVSKVQATVYTPPEALPEPEVYGSVESWLEANRAGSVWEVVMRNVEKETG